MKEPRDPPPPLMTPSTYLHLRSPAIQSRPSNLYDGHELKALAAHLTEVFTPQWSPKIGGGKRSDLYDSFEVNAVTTQLNGALRAARNGTTLYPDTRFMGCLQKKASKKHKQVSGLQTNDDGAKEKSQNFWKRVKQAIAGNK